MVTKGNMKVTVVVACWLLSGLSAQLTIKNSGPCSCDLTVNKCDVDCCCDLSCTAGQIQTFTCTNDLISPLSYGCFPTELLFQNNTPYLNVSVGVQYCVYADNYTLRNFYVPPTILSAINMSGISPTNGMPVVSTSFNAGSLYSATNYLVGASIPTIVQNAAVGFLALSRPDVSGLCLDGLPVGYLVTEVVSCNRVITNISNDCANLPSTSFYYTPNMLVPRLPYYMVTTFSIGSFANSPYFATVTCSGCSLSTQYNSASGQCMNVVTQVKYEIQGEDTISGVIMTLTYANVNSNFSQLFNVTYTKTGYNASGVQRSGNPGYIIGNPVQGVTAGVVQNIMMISGGDCASGPTSPIMFGVDSFTDCYVNISTPNNSCPVLTSSVNTSLSSYLSPNLLPYGNRSSLNPVPLTYTDNSATAPNCSAITKLTLYIIFARTGTLTLPQNTIIGYQAAYSFDSISKYSNGQQYWVTVAVKFVDNSATLFDLSGQIAKANSKTSVKDFLYLLYVENGGLGRPKVSVYGVTISFVLLLPFLY